MISTGTERKNSTTAPQVQRSHRARESRPRPNTIPKMPARTTEMAAALSVAHSPGRR